MAIQMATHGVRRIVEMNHLYSRTGDRLLYLRQSLADTRLRADVKAGSPKMSGIQADSQSILIGGQAGQHVREILKTIAQLAAAAHIVLQKQHNRLSGTLEHHLDSLYQPLHSGLFTCTTVTSNMKDDAGAAVCLRSLQGGAKQAYGFLRDSGLW